MTPPTTPTAYHHVTDVIVRFHDIDALGHVNNARYLNYLEEARMAYATDVCGWDGNMQTLSLIVANVTIDFSVPVHLEDKLQLHTRVSRLGNKSFDFEYLFMVQKPGQATVPAATAKTTMVMFDYTTHKTVPISPRWRDAMLAHEPDLID